MGIVSIICNIINTLFAAIVALEALINIIDRYNKKMLTANKAVTQL